MEQKRGTFSGKIGFVLAAAGSAVGLGNIWRFPYLAAKYGGGIFLLVYLVLVVSLGFALMVAEVALGRKTQLSAVGAFRKLNGKFGFLGYLASVVPIIIFPYYCVIGGWVMKYLAVYLTGQGMAAAEDTYFSNYIAQPVEPLVWLAVYVGVTALIVFFGVQKGVEKASKVMMPVLAVLSIGVAAYSVTRPGALDGVAYYLTPDFSRFSPMTVLAAMGQMFYSMSLAMGIMVTYGSYMKKEDDLEKSVKQIELFDTGMAFVAGSTRVPRPAAGMTALRIFCMGNILLWYFLFYSPTGRGKHEPRLPPPQNERRIHSSIFDTPGCRCHPGSAGKGGK